MKIKNRRKSFFIKQEFQGKSIFRVFVGIMLACVVFTIILSAISFNSMMPDAHSIDLGAMLKTMTKRFLFSYLLFLPIGSFFIILVSLFLTHRIAGPIYRFEKTLDDMINGQINLRIHLRKGDEGNTVALKINEFNAMLTDRIEKMKHLSTEIEAALVKTVDIFANQQLPQEAKGNLNNLLYVIDVNRDLRSILYDFNTSS